MHSVPCFDYDTGLPSFTPSCLPPDVPLILPTLALKKAPYFQTHTSQPQVLLPPFTANVGGVPQVNPPQSTVFTPVTHMAPEASNVVRLKMLIPSSTARDQSSDKDPDNEAPSTNEKRLETKPSCSTLPRPDEDPISTEVYDEGFPTEDQARY